MVPSIKGTRLGATISLKTHILPNFIYGYGAKWNIKDAKKDFAKLNAALNKFKKADQDVNIDGVTASLIELFKSAGNVEHDLEDANDDVFVLEFRSLEILKKFHDEFNKLLENKNLKLTPEMKTKLQQLPQKYKGIMAQLDQKLYDMAQEMRREKQGREMWKDIDWRQFFFVNLQMRLKSNDLRKKSSRLNSVEKKLEHHFKDILNKPVQKSTDKVVAEFDKRFGAALTDVVADAIFIEKMIIRQRQRLQDVDEEQKVELKRLISEGFPEENIGLIKKQVENLDAEIIADMKAEYAKAREVAHLLKASADLKMAS